MIKKINQNRKLRRKRRISSNLVGTSERPRIAVFRSNRYTLAQAIDDQKRVTIAAFSSQSLTEKNLKKTQAARKTGQTLGKILLEKKIKQAIFDRSIYAYKGRVKELAEGLREAGIKI
jgi:large subunit ribosomal protein L18